jgi:hypothetical protein
MRSTAPAARPAAIRYLGGCNPVIRQWAVYARHDDKVNQAGQVVATLPPAAAQIKERVSTQDKREHVLRMPPPEHLDNVNRPQTLLARACGLVGLNGMAMA